LYKDVPVKHFPWRETGWAMGFVALFAALYVGSYYALVEKSDLSEQMWTWEKDGEEWLKLRNRPQYLGGYDVAERFYSPVFELDSILRPGHWYHDFPPGYPTIRAHHEIWFDPPK